MTDTTTIEITDDQKDELADRREYPKEPYKSVLRRLLSADDSGIDERADGTDVDDSRIAADVVRQFDYAELAKQTADEIEGRMR